MLTKLFQVLLIGNDSIFFKTVPKMKGDEKYFELPIYYFSDEDLDELKSLSGKRIFGGRDNQELSHKIECLYKENILQPSSTKELENWFKNNDPKLVNYLRGLSSSFLIEAEHLSYVPESPKTMSTLDKLSMDLERIKEDLANQTQRLNDVKESLRKADGILKSSNVY